MIKEEHADEEKCIGEQAARQNNFNHYNKNKRGILDKVYYVDEFGIEYWHGEPIESKEATKEE